MKLFRSLLEFAARVTSLEDSDMETGLIFTFMLMMTERSI